MIRNLFYQMLFQASLFQTLRLFQKPLTPILLQKQCKWGDNNARDGSLAGRCTLGARAGHGTAVPFLFAFGRRCSGSGNHRVILHVVLCRVLRVYVRYRVRIRLSGDVVRFCFGRVFQGSGTLFAVANAEVEKEDVNQESC